MGDIISEWWARSSRNRWAASSESARHDTDPGLYAEVMLSWEMRAYREALAGPGPVFFDRGITELVGYHRLMGLAVPDHFVRAASGFRYHQQVFVAPPWAAIFAQDAERKQSFDEAVRTCEAVTRAYAAAGYELITLPMAPVQERLAFVLSASGLGLP